MQKEDTKGFVDWLAAVISSFGFRQSHVSRAGSIYFWYDYDEVIFVLGIADGI
ncbi:hypothetical protein [Dehalococcoides mccartyi]|uniref:Uncharacterized protein n=1 Tax=Dehalococcoides mccartyi (strain CBDB1) TaxID=255470 RepID=A0A916NW60_DEHMC|nr:hypothetical protein [Dehalococcoides mccartyi]CAI83608.1 hypothetical protein cbdbA1584 [Dehalococcoides mccartyi CBDB1]